MKRLRFPVLVLCIALIAGTAVYAVPGALHGAFEGFPIVRVVVNGVAVQGDVPAINFRGRTMVPVRFVSEALGATVGWDAATWTASIALAGTAGLQQQLTAANARIAELEALLPPPATAPFTIGDTVRIGEFRITVNRTRIQTSGRFFSPPSGHVWFIVDCSLVNMHATAAQTVSSLLNFRLVDRDGRSQKLAVVGVDTRGALDGTLGAGRMMTGEIAWEVPTGARGLELIFQPDLFQPGQAIFALGDLSP